MGQEKYCIFHIPNDLDPNAGSGSHVRPGKMLEAFRMNGYQVDPVMGTGKHRKNQIKKIKRHIKEGRKYEFLYSESSTMPTLLTEKHHLPVYPTLDFGFFKYCRRHGIPIGLFYRDIHWKYERYQKVVPWYKKMVSIPMYRYDLKQYEKLLDVLYLASESVKGELAEYHFSDVKALPPGTVADEEVIRKRQEYFQTRTGSSSLRLFYVGGIQGMYDLTGLLKAIQQKKQIYMTICCRENEWAAELDRYRPYLTERIEIVHASGDQLKEYYLQTDICCCCFSITKYMQMAMPVKLFEYTTYATPVIVTKGTEAGTFVEKWDNGFVVKYDTAYISRLLDMICENPEILREKHDNAVVCLQENTWRKRAYQVEQDLSG